MIYIKFGEVNYKKRTKQYRGRNYNRLSTDSYVPHFHVDNEIYKLNKVTKTRHQIKINDRNYTFDKCTNIKLIRKLEQFYNVKLDKSKLVYGSNYSYHHYESYLFYGPIDKDEAVILRLTLE